MTDQESAKKNFGLIWVTKMAIGHSIKAIALKKVTFYLYQVFFLLNAPHTR